MSDVTHYIVSDDDDGQRLDRWIKKHVKDLPYVAAQKMMRKGAIRVDSKRAKPDMRLSAGQDIRIPPVEKNKPHQGPRPLSDEDRIFIKSLVIYQDEHVIALNKPADLAVQGGTKTNIHVDGLLEGLIDKKGVKPRLVHRLDKDTSGVLLLARSAKVARDLGKAFKERTVKKIYWALVSPCPEIYEGSIKAPLAKAGGPDREKVVVDEEDGKFALSDYVVVEHAGEQAAFVAFSPQTGRTHQLRVHAQLLGCPIIGDHKYKAERDPESKKPEVDLSAIPLAKRLHLHAQRLILPHPGRPGSLDISAPLPEALIKSWKALGFDSSYKGNPFDV